MSDEPNDAGLSRHHIISSAEASLRRLGTDHIDLYQLHGWDGQTPLEETLGALDSLVRSGKVRYVGASNFSAWHLMKALGVSERTGPPRLVSQQIYYSLASTRCRDRARAGIDRPRSRHPGVEPDRRWPALRQVPPSGAEAAEGSRHLSGDWDEPPINDREKLYDTIEVLSRSARHGGCRPHRSLWPTCSPSLL